jgi:RNA polymerase primary sigma factor
MSVVWQEDAWWRGRFSNEPDLTSDASPEDARELSEDSVSSTPAVSPDEQIWSMDDTLSLYIHDIGQYPLLTRDEEMHLAQLKTLGVQEKSKPLHYQSAEVIARGEAAARALVEANLRLVISIAKKYHTPKLSLLDLIQEGNLGLIRAVEKYDERKGYRLTTYAIWWIRQAVARAVMDKSRLIRLPAHVNTDLSRIARVSDRLVQEYGREPTAMEIAEAMNMSITKVRHLLALADPVSLDMPLDEETKLGDVLSDPHVDSADETVDLLARATLKDEMRAGLQELTPREQAILVQRFGLDGNGEHTLAEISQAFQLSRERIRQIELKALQKLRNGLHPHVVHETRP